MGADERMHCSEVWTPQRMAEVERRVEGTPFAQEVVASHAQPTLSDGQFLEHVAELLPTSGLDLSPEESACFLEAVRADLRVEASLPARRAWERLGLLQPGEARNVRNFPDRPADGALLLNSTPFDLRYDVALVPSGERIGGNLPLGPFAGGGIEMRAFGARGAWVRVLPGSSVAAGEGYLSTPLLCTFVRPGQVVDIGLGAHARTKRPVPVRGRCAHAFEAR